MLYAPDSLNFLAHLTCLVQKVRNWLFCFVCAFWHILLFLFVFFFVISGHVHWQNLLSFQILKCYAFVIYRAQWLGVVWVSFTWAWPHTGRKYLGGPGWYMGTILSIILYNFLKKNDPLFKMNRSTGLVRVCMRQPRLVFDCFWGNCPFRCGGWGWGVMDRQFV